MACNEMSEDMRVRMEEKKRLRKAQAESRRYDRERYDPERQIMIIWGIDDVKLQEGWGCLSDAQAMDVLMEAQRTHDASEGIHHETLTCIAEAMYGELKTEE